MAGVTQHRSRGSIVKTPSASSGDGTLADAPTNKGPLFGKTVRKFQCCAMVNMKPDPFQHTTSAHDEIAPLGASVLEALRIVSKLEQLGLDKQHISLPKCVVLGTYRSNEEPNALKHPAPNAH